LVESYLFLESLRTLPKPPSEHTQRRSSSASECERAMRRWSCVVRGG